MEPFLGQIQPTGLNFAPRGWASCEGQLLAISQNSALFSLLGTNFGGDGRTTFGLPDLRGRVMIGQGRGNGLTDHRIGQIGGTETVTLSVLEIPSHSHPAVGELKASSAAGSSAVPSSRKNVLSASSSGNIYGSAAPDIALNTGGSATGGNTGGNQAHNNMPPFLALYISIALQGVFPSRN